MKPQCTTEEELHEEYARVIRMCKGTLIKPYRCVKHAMHAMNGTFEKTPAFTSPPQDYKFAIALVEDRPVWLGDELYFKDDTDSEAEVFVVSGVSASTSVLLGDKNRQATNLANLTWTKPPHPHAEFIKAWKNGVRVEIRRKGGTGTWGTVFCADQFTNSNNAEHFEFRLAPKTICIEGEDLVLPGEPSNNTFDYYCGCANAKSYGFTNIEDREKWLRCIAKWMGGTK